MYQSLRILEETKDYLLTYCTFTSLDVYNKPFFGLEVTKTDKNTLAVRFASSFFTARCIPTTSKKLEKELRKLVKKVSN